MIASKIGKRSESMITERKKKLPLILKDKDFYYFAPEKNFWKLLTYHCNCPDCFVSTEAVFLLFCTKLTVTKSSLHFPF